MIDSEIRLGEATAVFALVFRPERVLHRLMIEVMELGWHRAMDISLFSFCSLGK